MKEKKISISATITKPIVFGGDGTHGIEDVSPLKTELDRKNWMGCMAKHGIILTPEDLDGGGGQSCIVNGGGGQCDIM